MKNIKILALKKEKNKYILQTNEDEYNIDEETIIKFNLYKDKIITEEELTEIINIAKQNKYFNKALHYLSYKMRSIFEMKQYLQNKNASQKDIEVIITRLKNLGYLDDIVFAEGVFDYCLRNNRGPYYLKHQLEEKKVSEKIINKILAKYSEKLEQERITDIINKEAPKIKTYPINKQKQKVVSKLLRNGFNHSIVYEIINSYPFQDESDKRLQSDYQKIISKYNRQDLSNKEVRTYIINNLLRKGYEYQKILTILE